MQILNKTTTKNKKNDEKSQKSKACCKYQDKFGKIQPEHSWTTKKA